MHTILYFCNIFTNVFDLTGHSKTAHMRGFYCRVSGNQRFSMFLVRAAHPTQKTYDIIAIDYIANLLNAVKSSSHHAVEANGESYHNNRKSILYIV